MAFTLASSAATRAAWATLPGGLTGKLEEWGLDRAQYLVGLCELGEPAAKDA